MKFRDGDIVTVEDHNGLLTDKRTVTRYGDKWPNCHPDDADRLCLDGSWRGGHFDPETGWNVGSRPGIYIRRWTPKIERRYRLQRKQSEVAKLVSKIRETQWHRKLNEGEADKLIELLTPVRERY